MDDHQQSFTYHSLYRHVQSIMPQYQNKGYPTIYSSNKQPHLPSILERSREKKSHEKSLKKGISRVSKSKTKLKENNECFEVKQSEKNKSVLKGTLLNFNIQEVVQNNNFHISKPKDELIERSGNKGQTKEEGKMYKSILGSNQKSFISEYRIITYVPGGYVGEKKGQQGEKNEKLMRSRHKMWDKENNLNRSNITKQNWKKQDTEQVQITNPTNQHVLQLNTWRTSENFDFSYSNNFRTQLIQNNHTNNDKPYSSFQPRYSIPLTLDVNKIHNSQSQITQLKNKIKHLQRQIVDIERKSSSLSEQNQVLQRQNGNLREQNQIKFEKIQSLSQQIVELKAKLMTQQGQIKEYEQKLEAFQHRDEKYCQSHLYEQKQQNLNSKLIQPLNAKIQQLQILNATISRQLSQKNLIITQLNNKNFDLSQKIKQLQQSLQKSNQHLQDQQQKLIQKVDQIKKLNQQVQSLNYSLQIFSKQNYQNYPSQPIEQSKQRQQVEVFQQRFDELSQKYEKLMRDYNHLQKKHNFMKDELQHLKYLQVNGSSSYESYKSNKKQQGNLIPTKVQSEYEQCINELQVRLQMNQRGYREIQEEYQNLKQNFRALEELYIKQKQQFDLLQEQFDQKQQQYNKILEENLKLKEQLKKREKIQNENNYNLPENDQIKIMEKEEIIIGLKRQLNSTQRSKLQMVEQLHYLQKQSQQLNRKYIQQVQRNTLLSKRYKQDLALYTAQIQKQQQQKTSIIVNNYQHLLEKLNHQISSLKNQTQNLKDINFNQIIKLQSIHKKQVQQLKQKIQQKQNQLVQYQHSLKISYNQKTQNLLDNEIANRKQLELLNLKLRQECNIMQIQIRNVLLQKEKVEDFLIENERKMNTLEKDILFYKQQNQNLVRTKLEISSQLERVNLLFMELKKVNSLFEEQRLMFNKKLQELSIKYTISIKQNQSFIDQIKILKKNIKEMQIQSQTYQISLRDLRVSLLQEKQLSQKRLKIIDNLRQQTQNLKSQQEFFRSLYEKAQRELQLQKQQTSFILLEKQKQSLKISPIKLQSPLKTLNTSIQVQESSKDRQTELYRIQIYKDLNKLLNLTLQNFTLEQILQKNQQEYLRRLFNAIKQDHDKILELKQLIVAMEEGFKDQKVRIKQDYDLVYEKYLKYKSMSQAMQKDIQRYKQKLKKKDLNFQTIKI